MGKATHTSLVGEKHIVQLISESFLTPGDIARRVEEFQEMGFSSPVCTNKNINAWRQTHVQGTECRKVLKSQSRKHYGSPPVLVSVPIALSHVGSLIV